MSADIPESDWRQFKELHKKLLDRYCCQILEEIVAAAQSTQGSPHDRYLKVYKLVDDRDERLGKAFNDYRRSTALMQLAIMRKMKLLPDEDLSLFSEKTRMRIEMIASL